MTIATSSRRADAKKSFDALNLPADTVIIDRDDVERAKPEPDLFLACQDRLGVEPQECYVIGDAVWDLLAARRAGMLGIGLLSGGYGQDELYQAGAYRVYSNPAELLGSKETTAAAWYRWCTPIKASVNEVTSNRSPSTHSIRLIALPDP